VALQVNIMDFLLENLLSNHSSIRTMKYIQILGIAAPHFFIWFGFQLRHSETAQKIRTKQTLKLSLKKYGFEIGIAE
jgi:hypothetical protein